MSTIEKNDLINKNNLSTQYGLVAGMMMTGVLFLFQISGNDFSPFLKLSKYILLALAIVMAILAYKENISGDIFIKGISLGTKMSLIAGIFMVIANTFLYFFSPELAFSKYSIEPTSIQQMILVSAILFFETMVFGSIITFAILQFLKGRVAR